VYGAKSLCDRLYIAERESASILIGRGAVENCCLELYSPLYSAMHCDDRPGLRPRDTRDLHISACVWPIIMFHPVFNEWLHYCGPRHRGVDFLLLCALKNQPPTHVREYVAARVSSSHTMQRASHTESFLLCRTHARTRAYTRTSEWYGKIGDCNFSQRRRSLHEPLIIGPPGIYRVEGWSSVARLNFGYFSVVWCLLKWIFYCRLCHPRPLHSSARPRKYRARFR